MFKRLLALFFNKTSAPQPTQASQIKSAHTPTSANPAQTSSHNDDEESNRVLDEARLASSSMEESEWLFYDFLLGPSNSTDSISVLERNILIRVNAVLANPDTALEGFPNLPDPIIKLMDMLKTEQFDLDLFCRLLEKDPAIASRLITTANSAQYKGAGSKDITDIRHAFMAIGAQGVKQHVLQGFVRDLTRLSPIYFKMFGERIWLHSDDTANICRYLAKQRGLDQETAFLIGLVHDLGKILVFKLMVDAFKTTHPDEKLESLVMKKLLQTKSMALSYSIAQKWALPQIVQIAIQELAQHKATPPKSDMGNLLVAANYISECCLAREYQLFSESDFDNAIAKLNSRVDIQEYLAIRWQQRNNVA